MQIREARIFGFGKLKEQRIQFEPGINVIYGANEAGKSTLHAFLLAMLFGMDKGRGRASAGDDYKRYEPWHSPAYYSGALRFEVGGRPFYLERNFYHREKRDFLRNEADGEELSVAYGDLTMLLGGIQKETFGNTYDIPQSGAVTGKELSDSLAEYLSDVAESGDSGFRVTRALERLREKKKKLNVELKKEQGEKEQHVTALQIEQGLLQRDCLKLREDIAEAEASELLEYSEPPEHSETAAQEEQSRHTNRMGARGTMRRGITFLVLAVCFGMSALTLFAIGAKIPQEIQILRFVPGGLGLMAVCFAVAGGRTVWRARQQRETLLSEQNVVTQEQNQGGRALVLLQETLGERETRLYNITEQLQQLEKQTERELELQQEIDAVQLAADELERLAKEFCEEAADGLNCEVSRYVSAITAGKYDCVRVGEGGKLWVVIDGKEVSPEALSRGTLEQFYLALRLAAGEIATREEAMPIFLDDAFVLYDDYRLAQALRVLSGMGRQILLFTCQKRETRILSEMGIPCHLINL